MSDLTPAIHNFANLGVADDDDLCVEMFKYSSGLLKNELLISFNEMICTGEIDVKLHHTIFQMLPETGDLTELQNWRSIAILQVIDELFARMIYERISPGLSRAQSSDQHVFTPNTRIQDALLCAEVPRKAFGTVDLRAIFSALQRHGVDRFYIVLLELLYRNQKGPVHGSN